MEINIKRATKEYKDTSEEWRVTQISQNGNITHASSEGYKNVEDLRQNEINSSIAVLEHYHEYVNASQLKDLSAIALEIVGKLMTAKAAALQELKDIEVTPEEEEKKEEE